MPTPGTLAINGLDFNGGAPVAINNSAMDTAEGCSSISDDNGAILFYTDGVSVWNKNHVPMANGTGLGGGSSSTQSACIVKQPGVNTNYYIFTSGEFNSTGGFQYNIVDISTNGGLGSVILKNQILYTPTTQRVTAHTHSNGNDIWMFVASEFRQRICCLPSYLNRAEFGACNYKRRSGV